MTRVYLSLGSNIDRDANLRSGLDALKQDFGALQLSPVYESEAVGFEGDAFLNLVAAIDTGRPVGELAEVLRRIEADHGRVRGEKKYSSRTLDIDILTYGDAVGAIDGVTLPRGEILKHAFVLRPLADLAPAERHPSLGKTYAALLAEKAFEGQKLWQVEFRWP